MISDAKSPKFIAIQRPRNPTKSIRFQRLFFLFSMEYFGILCSRLFPSDDGIISRISMKATKEVGESVFSIVFEEIFDKGEIKSDF